MELVLTPDRHFELVNANDEIEWSSDDDDEFKEDFPDEFFKADDADRVIEWLIDADVLSESEADDLEIVDESEGEDFGAVIEGETV